jgi:hypothetical protein
MRPKPPTLFPQKLPMWPRIQVNMPIQIVVLKSVKLVFESVDLSMNFARIHFRNPDPPFRSYRIFHVVALDLVDIHFLPPAATVMSVSSAISGMAVSGVGCCALPNARCTRVGALAEDYRAAKRFANEF